MRWLLALCLLWPAMSAAQTAEVFPGELDLRVEVEAADHVPFVREMILITIHGTYRRHITREEVLQPDLDGFSWSQLGPDTWREERRGGQKVKTFRRRMALYPDRPGTLTIGAFAHALTLTDEADEWFEHRVEAAPVTVEVAPAPPGRDWWFPVRRLEVSDSWSNAPDQLRPGEGVLRIVRLEALGATPEMIPPMPDLVSPSGQIFAHPEQRFVELSPEGPVTYAFWRWTIRPGNDVAAIVEPMAFDYYDTRARTDRSVTISAQRVAYGEAVPLAAETPAPLRQAALPGWPAVLLGGAVFALGLALAMAGRRLGGPGPFDPLRRALGRAARAGDITAARRAAAALIARDGGTAAQARLLGALDRALFDPGAAHKVPRDFARTFRAAGRGG